MRVCTHTYVDLLFQYSTRVFSNAVNSAHTLSVQRHAETQSLTYQPTNQRFPITQFLHAFTIYKRSFPVAFGHYFGPSPYLDSSRKTLSVRTTQAKVRSDFASRREQDFCDLHYTLPDQQGVTPSCPLSFYTSGIPSCLRLFCNTTPAVVFGSDLVVRTVFCTFVKFIELYKCPASADFHAGRCLETRPNERILSYKRNIVIYTEREG